MVLNHDNEIIRGAPQVRHKVASGKRVGAQPLETRELKTRPGGGAWATVSFREPAPQLGRKPLCELPPVASALSRSHWKPAN